MSQQSISITPRNTSPGAQARAHIVHALQLISFAELVDLTPDLADEIQRSLHNSLQRIADSDRELASLELALQDARAADDPRFTEDEEAESELRLDREGRAA